MALNWNWSDKVGEATVAINEEGHTLSLYTGNAYLIMLNTWTEDGKDLWSMHSFWVDREHMLRMLGLKPKDGYGENHYAQDGYRITRFRFKKGTRNLDKMVAAIVKAFDDIAIEIYSE